MRESGKRWLRRTRTWFPGGPVQQISSADISAQQIAAANDPYQLRLEESSDDSDSTIIEDENA